MQSGPEKEENKIADIPLKPVDKASDSAIQKLKALGVMVIPVAQNINYLSANFITAIFTDKDLQLLEQIKDQLIWLKLGNTKITDAGLIYVSKLKNITKIYVENTVVTDDGLGSLKNLQQLQYLNLTATNVTANGIAQLKELKNLQQIYLYKTGVTGRDYFKLKKLFPQTVIDTGGYKLEMLVTDTTLVKPPKVKK